MSKLTGHGAGVDESDCHWLPTHCEIMLILFHDRWSITVKLSLYNVLQARHASIQPGTNLRSSRRKRSRIKQ